MSFALVNHVRLEDPEGAKRGAREVLVPRLRETPGFEQAVFLAEDADHGLSVLVFDTQEHAQAVAKRLSEEGAPDGVTFERQEVLEVVASS